MRTAKTGRGRAKSYFEQSAPAGPVAMGVDEARALAMAYELQVLLCSLSERREAGSVTAAKDLAGDLIRALEAAMDLMDDVIKELETLGPVHGKQSAHSLRLLVTDSRAYRDHCEKQALRSLASMPWRRP
jgi:hypothetical protein